MKILARIFDNNDIILFAETDRGCIYIGEFCGIHSIKAAPSWWIITAGDDRIATFCVDLIQKGDDD